MARQPRMGQSIRNGSPRTRGDGPMTDDPMPATACALLRGDLIPRSGRPIARFHYRLISSPQPLTSHPIPIAIEIAVPLPQQLLSLGKRTDLLAGGRGPAWQGRLRARGGRA